jgi:hypothetical protein
VILVLRFISRLRTRCFTCILKADFGSLFLEERGGGFYVGPETLEEVRDMSEGLWKVRTVKTIEELEAVHDGELLPPLNAGKDKEMNMLGARVVYRVKREGQEEKEN